MVVFYLLAVRCYGFSVRIASLFNKKAAAWISGRKDWERRLKAQLGENRKPVIWFHCASTGEFEQGQPILKQLKKDYPHHLVVLTFFSPSGFEARKNDPLADVVAYLPEDSFRNARRFLDLVRPDLAFFVKYEFWYCYGLELKRRGIPFFCVSAIFRPGQLFFRTYGGFFRRMLSRFTHLFVQDSNSLELLYRQGIVSVTVSGDTRFERVVENSQREAHHLQLIESFCLGRNVMVAGSTWPEDDELLARLLERRPDLSLILVPHEISAESLKRLGRRFSIPPVLFSSLSETVPDASRVLVIDSIGILSLLYRYGRYAYVGGGFGKGIHNILEAAVYGKPVFFGPRFEKFREARQLVEKGGAFPVKNADELFIKVNHLDPAYCERIGAINRSYVSANTGATRIIMNYLRQNFPDNRSSDAVK